MIWHTGDYWLYKPNVEKLKEIVSMPVGSCALVSIKGIGIAALSDTR